MDGDASWAKVSVDVITNANIHFIIIDFI